MDNEKKEEYNRTLRMLREYPNILEAGALQLFTTKKGYESAAIAWVAWTKLSTEERMHWKQEIVLHITLLRDMDPYELDLIESQNAVEDEVEAELYLDEETDEFELPEDDPFTPPDNPDHSRPWTENSDEPWKEGT